MDKTLELSQILSRKGLADAIAERWEALKGQRSKQEDLWRETQEYVFATDTSTTSNRTLPWKNSTTLPKLCQLRDNLFSNYISALFPNDRFYLWEAHDRSPNTLNKRRAIQAYMANKIRESGFRKIVGEMLYDYIDKGNVFGDVVWINEQKKLPTGEVIAGYVGPKPVRISPLDHVFDPTSSEYRITPKITRSIVRYGEIRQMAQMNPGSWWQTLDNHVRDSRKRLTGVTKDDFSKAAAYSIQGFGSLQEYYGSGFVELLEFEGTIHSIDDDTLYEDHIITIVDRTTVVRKEGIPAWKRGGYKVHAGWRKRPDNLYAMGPLENLIGMQYRLDHLQNLAADIRDLTAAPPLVFRGELQEAVKWGPFAEFHMEPDGDVRPLFTGSDLNSVESEMMMLLNLMEEMAGAPKQAMGIRTPGEKTAFEVQALENAAGRIFQEKVTQFEIEVLEPLLNNMLEMAMVNMSGYEVIRVMDDDLGVEDFMTITKEDITAKGKIRAVGARHYASQAQFIQNLTGIANSNIWPKIEPHISDKALAATIEELLKIDRYNLVRDNAGIIDKLDSQRIMQIGQEQVMMEQDTDGEGL